MVKITPEGFARATEYFEQAIALDPQYAEPHSSLGVCFFFMGVISLRPAREVMLLARAAAARALERFPSDPSAHAVMSAVAAMYDYDWREAERQSRLALGAGPVPPEARCFAAMYLLALGRFEEALREFEAARAQDPLNLFARVMLGTGLLYAGIYDHAILIGREMMEIDEHYWASHNLVSMGYAWWGRFVEAQSFPAFQVRRTYRWAWHARWWCICGQNACCNSVFQPVSVMDEVQTAYQGTTVSQTYEGDRVFAVNVILNSATRRSPEDAGNLMLDNSERTRIPLRQLADVYETTGRYVVLHEATRRRQAVTSNISGRDVASFVAEARRKISEEVRFPAAVYAVYSGEAEAQVTSAALNLLVSPTLALRFGRFEATA